MAPKKDLLMKTTLSVTLIIALSKAIGFVRDMIMAYYFGRDMVTDAYNSAYSLFYLPVLLFSSCITSTLVPMYIKHGDKLGRDAANRFASNALNLFIAFSLIVSTLMMLGARPLVRLVYPGFSGDRLDLTVELSMIMFPALAFFVAGVALSTILNAQEHFLAAQLTGLPLSAALITAAVAFSKTVGIRAQAWGIVAAGVLQIVILLPALKKDFRYTFSFNIYDRQFKKLMVLAAPAILSMAVNELNHMIDRMLASTLNAGDISSMSYAFRLIMFMMGVLVVPLTTITFSRMSKQAAGNDRRAMVKGVHRSLELLSAVALPLVAIAGVCAPQIIRLAFGRGQFDDASVILTGQVFLFYVVGVPFFGTRDMLNRVYHSLQDTKTPMRVACVSMAINIALNFVLKGVMGVNGLALATSIAALAGVCMLVWGLKQRMRKMFSRTFVREIAKTLFATALALIAAIAISRLLPDWRGTFKVFLWLVIVTGASAIVYVTACLAMGARQLRRILRSLWRA